MFITAFVFIFLLASALMAATGWTGLTNTHGFTYTCDESGDCLAMVIGNFLGLMAFQSQYFLFNIFLAIFYVILAIAIVALLLGVVL